MKRRQSDQAALRRLSEVLAAMDDPSVVADFLDDLCTPAELEALADRWTVVPLVARGVPYREVHQRTGVSVTTVGRVARHWAGGAGGYRAALALTGEGDNHGAAEDEGDGGAGGTRRTGSGAGDPRHTGSSTRSTTPA